MSKTFTDVEQSKKLIELGIDKNTADMRIGNYVGKSGKVDGTNVHYYAKEESFGAPEIIPCWSLSALMGLMSKSIISTPNPFSDNYCCRNIEFDMECYADNPVDAVFEMVCWLKENKKI